MTWPQVTTGFFKEFFESRRALLLKREPFVGILLLAWFVAPDLDASPIGKTVQNHGRPRHLAAGEQQLKSL